jgi:hypothetical protein
MCAFCLFVYNAVGHNVYQFFISVMLLYLNVWDKVLLSECEIGWQILNIYMKSRTQWYGTVLKSILSGGNMVEHNGCGLF